MKKTILAAIMVTASTFATYGHAMEEHQHGDGSYGNVSTLSGLSLNNGERWEMDAHTRTMTKQIQKAFFSADHTTLEGLKAVGKTLEQQMQELIAGCTMSGKAHEQLHVFLSQHIPTIEALATSDNYTTARDNAIRLKGQLDTYQKHFK
ncbi:MAG: hypothetical protein OQL17_12210 [Sedimenticola sp.]|nr:hypothetical protein [Sedimenticola sp.]MCW8950742.1 hypothetical protein [Sedimenticola sp.]